jgi:hypothetical protein
LPPEAMERRHVHRQKNFNEMDWEIIDTAPFGHDLEICVIEDGEVYALVFPCRRADGGWSNALTRELVIVHPTHWRYWAVLPPKIKH